MSIIVNRICKSLFLDSVVLMQISRTIAELDGVEDAALMIGTPSNLAILDDAELLELVEIESDTSDGDITIATQGTGVINLTTDTQTTVGSAGGASALPGAPTGYVKIKIGGTLRVIPFWDQA